MPPHTLSHYKAGEALGYEREPRRKVAVGEVYGHLKVEALSRRRNHYDCVCVLEDEEGKPCGRPRTISTTMLLRDAAFRACKPCVSEHTRVSRQRFSSGYYATGGG